VLSSSCLAFFLTSAAWTSLYSLCGTSAGAIKAFLYSLRPSNKHQIYTVYRIPMPCTLSPWKLVFKTSDWVWFSLLLVFLLLISTRIVCPGSREFPVHDNSSRCPSDPPGLILVMLFISSSLSLPVQLWLNGEGEGIIIWKKRMTTINNRNYCKPL
jgi:hypothetical protein